MSSDALENRISLTQGLDDSISDPEPTSPESHHHSATQHTNKNAALFDDKADFYTSKFSGTQGNTKAQAFQHGSQTTEFRLNGASRTTNSSNQSSSIKSLVAATNKSSKKEFSLLTTMPYPAACSSAIHDRSCDSQTSTTCSASPTTHSQCASAARCSRTFDLVDGVRPIKTPSDIRDCPTQSQRVANERTSHVMMVGDSEMEQQKTLLCLVWHNKMLGACVFKTETMKLQIMQDTDEICTQIQPDVIIVALKQDTRFTEILRHIVSSTEKTDTKCELATLPNKDLGFEVSKRRFQQAFEASLDFSKKRNAQQQWSQLTMNQINMIRAAGGLLRYLELNSADLLKEGLDPETPALSIEQYFMNAMVWIDRSSLSALRIIHLADHPSSSLGSMYTREGFSLYSLMDRCQSSTGKKKLKEWFLRPSRDIRLLNNRLDCLEFFSPTCNSEITQLLKQNLGKLRNMTRIICQMKNAGLSGPDWLALFRVTQSLIMISEVCYRNRSKLPLFVKFDAHRDSIQTVGQYLTDILDLEQTRVEKHFTIKPNYDEELDRLVQRHRDLPDILGEHLTDHVQDMKRLAKSAVHIHYSSQLGCLLMIDITPHMERTGNYNIDGLELEFLSDEHGYYSTAATKSVTEHFGDVKTAITDRTLALMYQLQNTILPEMDSLIQLLDLCAEIDCCIALSAFCYEHSYVRPALVDETTLHIPMSRHPLLGAQVDCIINNDILSATKNVRSRVTVLTGSNASGKSIYLKQVALNVYLAHIGCFIPAQHGARVGLVDAILTHFSMVDSINSDVSTFTSDLRSMSMILSKATERSLIVLDEFGKGTCPIDGAAILLSVLKHWLNSASGCPQIFLSTHFYCISRFKWLLQSPLVSFKMMDTELEGDKVTYLYCLVDGIAQTSNAAAIARMLEIPEMLLHAGRKAADQFHLAQRNVSTSVESGKSPRRKMIVQRLMDVNLADEAAVNLLLSFMDDEP